MSQELFFAVTAWFFISFCLGVYEHLPDLRHTCATLLLHEGCSLREIQSYLGHASYLTTTRYAHIDARSKEHALEIMSAVLNVDKDN